MKDKIMIGILAKIIVKHIKELDLSDIEVNALYEIIYDTDEDIQTYLKL